MTDCMCIILSKSPREGWDDAARDMSSMEEAENPWGELPVTINSDGEEWTW